MRFKIKVFIFFFFCYNWIGCVKANLKDLVLSFVISEYSQTCAVLMPKLCWSGYDKNLLARNLFEVNVFLAPSLQPNTTEYFLHQVVILADLSCPGTESFLIQASEQGYFKSPYRWLILDSDVGAYKFDLFDKLDMPLNSNVVIAKRIGRDHYHFIEAYKIAEGSDVIYTTRGAWQTASSKNLISLDLYNSNNSLTERNVIYRTSATNGGENRHVKSTKYGTVEDYRNVKIMSLRRMDITGHPLTMVMVVVDSNDTRDHLDDRLNLQHDSISKMSHMVVRVCFDMLNASEKRLFTHTWGYKDKDGNWQGLIDHLLKKEGDLGTITIFTEDRTKVIDYIAMIGSTAVRFSFREPPLALMENIFALPFTGAVWFAIFICVLGCAVFLYITSKWEASVSMHPLQLDGTWADVLILIIGAVLQQGCTLEPRYAAGRCVTLLLFVALTILYAAYSANIVVLLRAPSSSVKTLPDLLNSPLKLGASDFEYNRYFFSKMNDPIRKAIYDKKIAPKGKKPNFYSMKEGIEKVRKGLFAFHMELNPGYRLIQETFLEEEKCDLVEIDYLNEIDPWLPGQKRSPYKDLFKISFAKIRETGVQANIHHRLQVGKPHCSGSVSTFSSVGITDMYPALIATLYGAFFSVAVLILEIMYKRLMTVRDKRRTKKNLVFTTIPFQKNRLQETENMRRAIIWLLFLFNFNLNVHAKDMITINFVKSFIQNEFKPTSLIYRNLCWKKSETLKLTKELSNALNTRVSSNYREGGYLQDHTILFLVDLDCVHSKAVFNDSRLLRFPYRWLVLHDHQNQNQSKVQQLLDLPLLADSDFVLAERNENNFTLTELHKPSTFGPTHSNPRGQYNGKDSKLIDTRPRRELFRRRQDIMGHPLTVSNVIQESNSTQYHLPREDRLELQYDSIPKLCWMNIRVALEFLNATPRYIFSHRWGYKRNGQWSGMIDDLNRGRADLGTNCIPFVERLSVVVFTSSVSKFKTKFIFRQPPLSFVSNIFTLTFSLNVWIAVIVCIIVSCITICIATKWEASVMGADETQLDGSIGDATLLTICAVSQQGCSKEPKKLSGRIILLVVFTALMALYAAYSANIIVLLQASSNSIKTLEHLAHSKLTLAAVDLDANYFVLKGNKDAVRRLIYSKVEPAKGKAQFYSLDEGVELLRQGHFALYSTMGSIYRRIEQSFLETEKCDLMEVDYMEGMNPYVPVYKHSPYIELLKVAFKRIHESGIQMALHNRMQVSKPRCTGNVAAFSSVNLEHLRPVLLFIIYGIGVAVLILLAEISMHKISTRRTAGLNDKFVKRKM
ncbi:uncharacterized protein LOC123875831 [Maniola jurtina]|uniref:uncharacterized protein LOC123875831 n=1 Tax=Maniola jurtina TaxID=191418 RepID=UPI001E6898AC|nr:uncharacterized protein LOC123875831 [Maniola jurtina]